MYAAASFYQLKAFLRRYGCIGYDMYADFFCSRLFIVLYQRSYILIEAEYGDMFTVGSPSEAYGNIKKTLRKLVRGSYRTAGRGKKSHGVCACEQTGSELTAVKGFCRRSVKTQGRVKFENIYAVLQSDQQTHEKRCIVIICHALRKSGYK